MTVEMPSYALLELWAGSIRYFCLAHNKLSAASNPAEALIAFFGIPGVAGRSKTVPTSDSLHAMQVVFARNPDGSRAELKAEMLEYLALQATRLWDKSRKLKDANLTQYLSCFSPEKLELDENGILRGSGDSFNCHKGARCAAAQYLAERPGELDLMIEALHPDNLDSKAAAKRENSSRRRVLKDLRKNGAAAVNRSTCRAIGDAYFAGMCPAGATLVSTNVDDFAPLCAAMKKQLASP
jgi:hypothetical protein